MMKSYYPRSKEPPRHLNSGTRLSSASIPFIQGPDVAVTHLSGRQYSTPEEMRKTGARLANLKHLYKHLFSEDVPQMSDRAQLAPDRLQQMFDLQLQVSSSHAEHIERSMGLPAGWLETSRPQWTEADTLATRALLDASLEDDIQNERIHEARVFRVETPAQPATVPISITVPDAPTAPLLTITSPAAPQESTMSLIESTMAWINTEMDKTPRGTRSRLAKGMSRHPNDVSAWLNNLRTMPSAMRDPLIDSLKSLDLPFASEAEARLKAAYPIDSSEPGAPRRGRKAKVAPVLASDKSQEQVAAVVAKVVETALIAPVITAETPAVEGERPAAQETTATAQEKPVARTSAVGVGTKRSGNNTFITFDRRMVDSIDMDKVALQASATLAEIMQGIMRRRAAQAKESTEH